MKPYKIYLKDILVKGFYSTLSYTLCCSIIFWNIDIFFLFETYPFLINFTSKRFILTQLTQLFNIIQYYIIFMSLIYFSPLFLWYVINFFSNTWYFYQIKLFRVFMYVFINIFMYVFIVIHIILLPNVLLFFLSWESLTFNAIVRIEPEVTFDSYITWIVTFKILFSFLVAFIISFIFIFYKLWNLKRIYFLLFTYKRILLFTYTFIFFVLIPPDLFTQFIFFFFFVFIYEIFSLFICIKLYNFYKFNLTSIIKCQQLDSYLKNQEKNPT